MVCREKAPDGLLCDICNKCAHLYCLGFVSLPAGFWYCGECRKKIHTGHYREVTTDLSLMQFVFCGVHRDGVDAISKERIERAAKFLSV